MVQEMKTTESATFWGSVHVAHLQMPLRIILKLANADRIQKTHLRNTCLVKKHK